MQRQWLSSIAEWNGTGVISLLGATGSGKTSAAVTWARTHEPAALLVSVDSVAVYRGLDIGSAKPLASEREGLDWAGLDLLDPDAPITATDYVQAVSGSICRALEENRPVLLVGGSHFYERALVEGRGPGGATDPEFAASLDLETGAALRGRLGQRAPGIAARLHENDRYRLVRYLDLIERQGLSEEALTKAERSPLAAFNVNTVACLAFGIGAERAIFEDRLRARVAQMFESGWVEETSALLNRFGSKAPGLTSIGYREIVEFLGAPAESESDLREQIFIQHRQLAKKQRTWIRGLRARSA